MALCVAPLPHGRRCGLLTETGGPVCAEHLQLDPGGICSGSTGAGDSCQAWPGAGRRWFGAHEPVERALRRGRRKVVDDPATRLIKSLTFHGPDAAVVLVALLVRRGDVSAATAQQVLDEAVEGRRL